METTWVPNTDATKGDGIMDREIAIKLIDEHKNGLLNPVEMLDWTWLRIIINCLDQEAWDKAVDKGIELLSR